MNYQNNYQLTATAGRSTAFPENTRNTEKPMNAGWRGAAQPFLILVRIKIMPPVVMEYSLPKR